MNDESRTTRLLSVRDRFIESIAAQRVQFGPAFAGIFDALTTFAVQQTQVLLDGDASEELLDLNAAAKRLSVSRDTLRILTQRGDVRALRIPSPNASRPLLRYRTTDLDQAAARWAS